MSVKVLTAREAADLIPNGVNLATNGFIGASFPEEIAIAIEQRFLETGAPNDLTLLFCAAQGDSKDKGLNHFAHDGMVRRAIGGHWGLAPKLGKMVADNKIIAYDFPQGVTAHMFRDAAAHKPGTLTHVGLGTFVDPRLMGGKLNELTRQQEDLVELMEAKSISSIKTSRSTSLSFPAHMPMKTAISPWSILALRQKRWSWRRRARTPAVPWSHR